MNRRIVLALLAAAFAPAGADAAESALGRSIIGAQITRGAR
jgi:hypothetical protein